MADPEDLSTYEYNPYQRPPIRQRGPRAGRPRLIEDGVQLQLYLPKDVADELRRIADRLGVARTVLIRQIINEWLSSTT